MADKEIGVYPDEALHRACRQDLGLQIVPDPLLAIQPDVEAFQQPDFENADAEQAMDDDASHDDAGDISEDEDESLDEDRAFNHNNTHQAMDDDSHDDNHDVSADESESLGQGSASNLPQEFDDPLAGLFRELAAQAAAPSTPVNPARRRRVVPTRSTDRSVPRRSLRTALEQAAIEEGNARDRASHQLSRKRSYGNDGIEDLYQHANALALIADIQVPGPKRPRLGNETSIECQHHVKKVADPTAAGEGQVCVEDMYEDASFADADTDDVEAEDSLPIMQDNNNLEGGGTPALSQSPIMPSTSAFPMMLGTPANSESSSSLAPSAPAPVRARRTLHFQYHNQQPPGTPTGAALTQTGSTPFSIQSP